MNYILDQDGTAVPEPDVLKWAIWFGSADRTVAHDELPDGVVVSTVFLGIDHQFGDGSPLLFETMVFGGTMDESQVRFTTRADALAGHQVMVNQLMAAHTEA